MRRYQLFLITFTVILLSFTSFGSIIAQEELTEIVKMIEPSTILILTYDEEGNPTGQGSGFFISQNGEVITNRHVILNAAYAEIKTLQGDIYPITHIIAEDKEGDIIRVLVDIPQEKVKPLMVSVSIPEAGERIVVIGNPLGLERTVADGIVSAVRDVPGFGRIIQITAPISPGSSGSPVVNMKGEVIGIATFQLIEGQNLNFAISSERIAKLELNKAKPFAEWQLHETKRSTVATEDLYYSGLRSVLSEDFKNGLSYFVNAVQENPSYADAYFYIGYCNGELGHYSEAIEAYKQVVQINPDNHEAYYNLGYNYAEIGILNAAMDAFKRAIRINPDYTKAYYGLGAIYYGHLELYNEALEAIKQVTRINPDDDLAYFILGQIYIELGCYNGAIDAFNQVIRINPDDAEAHYILGYLYDQLERDVEATDAYKQAMRLNPDYADADNNDADNNSCWTLSKVRRYGKMMDVYKQEIYINSEDYLAYFILGETYEQQIRYSQAIEAYKQAIRINPDFADAHYNLGCAYSELGRHSEAIEAYKQVIRLNPNCIEAHQNLGVSYSQLRLYNEAMEAFKQVIRINPDYARAHYGLGLIYLILDDKGSAFEVYKILKELDRDLANKLLI